MKIFINTATSENCVALVKKGAITAIKKWEHQKKDAHLLIDRIGELVVSWNDIDEIAVVTGPGPFTAVRIGVAAANTLAYSNHCKITPYNTFELLGAEKSLVRASKNAVFFWNAGDVSIINNDEILANTDELIADVYPHQAELIANNTEWKIEDLISALPEKDSVDMVEPTYFRDPQISKSANPLSLI